MEEKRKKRVSGLPLQIGLGDQIIEIQSLYQETHTLCQPYIVTHYAVPNMTIRITPEDIEREREAAQREERINGREATFFAAYLETTAVCRQIAVAMLSFDTFLMHGVVISCQGQGYMIAAPSGVGKTTRAKLWVEHIPDSFVVNGDKPLLRVKENGVRAFGTPWCGKEGWNANTSVPLRAIFLLERSDGGNKVEEMSFGEAFPALLRQTYRPVDSQARRQTLSLLQAMAGKVKLYRFCSEPTAEAVRLAWETAGEKR